MNNITTHEDGSIQLSNLKGYVVWMPTDIKINGMQMSYETKMGEAKMYIVYDPEDKEYTYGVLSTFGKCFKKWVDEESLHIAMLEAEEWAFGITGAISNNDWANASNEDREVLSTQSIAGAMRYNAITE